MPSRRGFTGRRANLVGLVAVLAQSLTVDFPERVFANGTKAPVTG